jgi:hypothetical protein
MLNNQPLDLLPNWVIFILTMFILLLSFEAGLRLGTLIQIRRPDRSEASVGQMVGAALTLLGLLLAFVISIAINNFNQRRQLVVSEANAIGTAYLRAGYLTEPYRVESRQLFREYVSLRLEALNPAKAEAAIARSEQIQDELWIRAEELARESPVPTISLYISALNEVIDMHTERLSAEISFRLPPTLLFGMLAVAVIAMLLFGMHDSYRDSHNLISLIMLVFVLSLVFLLIIGLDRSNAGLLQVPQKPLIDLQQRLILIP